MIEKRIVFGLPVLRLPNKMPAGWLTTEDPRFDLEKKNETQDAPEVATWDYYEVCIGLQSQTVPSLPSTPNVQASRKSSLLKLKVQKSLAVSW